MPVSQSDGLGHTVSYGYDAVGDRTTVTDANNNTTTYAYDSMNRLTTVTDPLSHNTVYGYDSGGNPTTATDSLGHATTTQYDALNRATTMTDARGGVTVAAYDAAGRNTVVVDPTANRTTFAYDAADRLTTLTTPLGTTTHVYDSANQLTDQTDADGRRTTYSYDSGGRQTGETWVGASPSEVVTYTYDADRELTGAKDANATLTFTYDSGGRQVTAATSSAAGQPNVTLTSGYNQINQRTSLSDNLSSAGVETLVYDAANRLTTITSSYGGTAGPQVILGYDNANRLTSESRTIGGSGTAVATSFSYDAANRLTTLTHQVSGGAGLATYVYGYDNANRLTSEQNAEGTVTYGYDNTNQLTGASGSRAETYTYDSGGNRTMAGYTTGTDNKLTASPGYTYTYDAEGNLTGKTQTSNGNNWTFTYDYRNRLAGTTEKNSGGTTLFQATYTYDALNRRIGTDVNSTQSWMVYDGQNPYATFNGSGTLQERYLYGPAVDEVLARTSSGGSTAWYLTDRLGTVRDLVNTSGTVLDHVAYDSYGNVLSESSPANGDQFKFDGMQYDAATGLYFDNARYYDPSSGRFMSQDPKGFAAGDANLYRYVGNGPTNAVDPSGEQGQQPTLPDLGPELSKEQNQYLKELKDALMNAIEEVKKETKVQEDIDRLELMKLLLSWMHLKDHFSTNKQTYRAYATTVFPKDYDLSKMNKYWKNYGPSFIGGPNPEDGYTTVAHDFFDYVKYENIVNKQAFALLHESWHYVGYRHHGTNGKPEVDDHAEAMGIWVGNKLMDKASYKNFVNKYYDAKGIPKPNPN